MNEKVTIGLGSCSSIHDSELARYASTASSIAGSISVDYSNIKDNILDKLEIKETQIKKPEVDPKTRTKLEVDKGHTIIIKRYRDGYYTGSKTLMSAIKDVTIYNNQAVKVIFYNDMREYVSSAPTPDQFDLEMGIMTCIMKKMINDEDSTQILNKLVRMGVKVYHDKLSAQKKAELEAKEKERIRIKNHNRAQRKRAKMLERKRKGRIQEMAEAIVAAGVIVEIKKSAEAAMSKGTKPKRKLLEKKGTKDDE